MAKSVKLRPETLYNFRNILCDSAERKADSPSFDWSASFPERYKREEFRIHMHARGGLAEFCAIFQYDAELRATKRVCPDFYQSANDGANANLGIYDLNKPVFVRIVDLFEPVKGILTPATAAFVWLQPLNECLMFRQEFANHASPVSEFHTFKMGIASPGALSDEEYRELGVACGCLGSQKRQLVNQAVQGGSQIVGNLANPDSPLRVRWLAARAHAIDIFACLRIELRLDDVILGILPEGFLGPSESLDFTYCTPYLEARAIQRLHYDTGRYHYCHKAIFPAMIEAL